MKKTIGLLVLLIFAVAVINSCGGGGGGGGGAPAGGGGGGTTTVSGSVRLSSTIGKPGLLKALFSAGTTTALSSAIVKLYDADRPDWLYPVAEELSDSEGKYTLSALKNAAFNGNGYTNGGPIPSGNYTIIAEKHDSTPPPKFYVKVQSVVKRFDGIVTNVDIEVIDSNITSPPSVVSMFGLSKNADGTFGDNAFEIPINAALQVTFDMPMSRYTVNAITIKSGATVTGGTWKMSPDLLSATYYPASNLTADTIYTVTVGTLAWSVYDKQIANPVVGKFKAKNIDILPPNVTLIMPEVLSNVPIATTLRIASSEVLDVNTFNITSSPSIGDKPLVLYVGKRADPGKPFVYEIQPAAPLALNTVYDVTVSGTKDMAGNSLTPYTFNFQTETTASMPTVINNSPASNATNVPIDATIGVTFSSLMDCLSVNGATFTLSTGATITSTVTCNGATATLTPLAPLAFNTLHTVLLTGGAGEIKDTAGSALVTYSWTFTTAGAPDSTPPTVLSTNPGNSATGVAVNGAISATFSEAVNPATISSATVKVVKSSVPGSPLAGALNPSGSNVTFTPSSALEFSTVYTATITGGASGVKDLAGNPLAADKVWSFTTGAAPDNTAPTVSTTAPTNGATNVAVGSIITINFSEAMLNASINSSTLKVTRGGLAVSGTVGASGSSGTFTPTTNLLYSTTYAVQVIGGASGVSDIAGNKLAATYNFSFTTIDPPAGVWDINTWDNCKWQ